MIGGEKGKGCVAVNGETEELVNEKGGNGERSGKGDLARR